MKYLFFDLECSNCYQGNGKVCEFGYVITDEKFNVIKKDVIPMSPGKHGDTDFDKKIYLREPGFQWAFDLDYYFEQPEFPYFYKRIKKLLEDEETIVFGFAVDNDIEYLGYTTKRYNLTPINFKAYDVVKFWNKYLKKDFPDSKGLSKNYECICDPKEKVRLQAHLSRDDAFMTMRLLEATLKKSELPFSEFIKPLTPIDAVTYYEKFLRKRASKVNRQKSNKLLSEEKDNLRVNENAGTNNYLISGKIQEDYELVKKIVNKIKENKECITFSFYKATKVICKDEDNKKELLMRLKFPIDAEFIYPEELFKEN